MYYEGPVYRPPSEADSLLIQATVGCPHNRCTFCMIYKNGPPFRIRKVADICRDITDAGKTLGKRVRTIFFPAGNTIAMKTDDLEKVLVHAGKTFPWVERMTVYGSSQFIRMKGEKDMARLKKAGLSRIHVGMESGDDAVLRHIRKGADAKTHTAAGKMVKNAGIELSEYVILGIGGAARTESHAKASADVLSAISPDFVRLRTFVPKINTPLLEEVQSGEFEMLGPHGVLRETRSILQALDTQTRLTSDHYTNYINLEGKLPEDREKLIQQTERAMEKDASCFRPFFIGSQ